MPFARHSALTPLRPPCATSDTMVSSSSPSVSTPSGGSFSSTSSSGPGAGRPRLDGVEMSVNTGETRIRGRDSDALTHLMQFGAGALAGFVNTLVLSPLDVVKTRLQAQGSGILQNANYRGPIDALTSMLRQEGFQSYYRGLSASLWAFVPNWAIYWYSYESFKRLYTRRGRRPSPIVHVLSAISAGGVTAVTTAPFWTLKSRLQVDMAVAGSQRKYLSVPHGFRKIIKEEGISGLYKGLTPTLLGLGHVAIQFPLYEHLKSTFANRSEGNETGRLKATHVLAASSLSKVVASAVFYPHEVIRTRIQLDTSNVSRSYEIVRVFDLFQRILKTDGMSGLYRGFAANLVRTVPACMLTFTSYELAKRFAETHPLYTRRFVKSSSTCDHDFDEKKGSSTKSASNTIQR